MPHVSAPLTGSLAWGGSRVHPVGRGLVDLVEAGADRERAIARRLGVRFDDDWSLVAELAVDDELETVWLSGSGEVATVRWVVGGQLRLRVRVVDATGAPLGGATGDPIALPGLRLGLDHDSVVQRWGGGARAFLLVDRGTDCLVVRQVAGFTLTDAEPGLPLFRGGTASTCEWVVERVDAPASLLRHLPVWWPDRLVRSAGEPVLLGDGSELPPSLGETQHVTVPEERGETVLTVLTLPDLDDVLTRALTETERLTIPTLVLAQSARQSGLARPWTDDDLLGAVEEGLARGSVRPLALAAAARELVHTGSADVSEAIIDALPRLAPAPGSQVARLHALMALSVVGHPAPGPSPSAGEPGPELDLITGRATPGALRLLALLGSGLPGEVDADPLSVAVAVALAPLAPAQITSLNRWVAPVAECARQATAALLAGQPSPEVIAWLVLGQPW
ncbi:hypothetical protein [Aestuariimicrobium sp. T2.26MG-19.2B]|uniref:hypothetical protein n=1 Tax=Aestuariimicrobium sp. T2.26MG-19.2B TaxID=3040679 RepID=UPI002477C983|nr:hypothetical protein [Aestuariimicrobium sp. T2.26MG-19.2B]CAI9407824.1 hypothetical protein AESSP_01902 [Aestuariimicrobium sp. T2.26MG-19.2B]